MEDSLKTLEEQMIKLECENEERERRKRQRKQEWQLYMDEISLLEEKLNTLKQRKLNPQNSIEEQLHFIRVDFLSIKPTSSNLFCVLLESKSRT